jgi:hypothetical protein
MMKYFFYVCLASLLWACQTKSSPALGVAKVELETCGNVYQDDEIRLQHQIASERCANTQINLRFEVFSAGAISSVFVDLHEAGVHQTHGVGGHQEGLEHFMDDNFQGRKIYSVDKGQIPENKQLVFERNFKQAVNATYMVLIGVVDKQGNYGEYAFYWTIKCDYPPCF